MGLFVMTREVVDRWNGVFGQRRLIVLTVVGERSGFEKDGAVDQSSWLAAAINPRQFPEEERLVPTRRRREPLG